VNVYRLSATQRAAIAAAVAEPNGWVGAHPTTAASLVRRGIARYESGTVADTPAVGSDQAYLTDEAVALFRDGTWR
jgi:hypothetical protein